MKTTRNNDDSSILSQIVKENGVEKLNSIWELLLGGVKSKYDTKGDRPTINKRAHIHRDQKDKQNRHCWTCNKSLYGQGLKYNGKARSLPVYHLALTSQLKTYKTLIDRFRSEDKMQKVKIYERRLKKLEDRIPRLSSGSYHITHTCGHGRKEKSKDFTNVCMNPKHLRIRTKEYNESQTHCHFYLHNENIELRNKFINANLCTHKPKCF
jgi:hypothetical protein